MGQGLDKATLKASIIEIFTFEQGEETSYNSSVERIAEKLSDAIEVFVKSGKVEVNSGIKLTTSGSSGTTVEKGIGKII
nr:MAG TPA: hypothetical protein [Caudoviricetes sp.]